MSKKLIQRIVTLGVAPKEKDAREKWLQMVDAILFLKESIDEEELIVFAASSSIYIYAILALGAKAEPPNVEDLLGWSLDVASSWSVWNSMGDPPDVGLCAPLEDCGSKTFVGGEQIIFARHFEGRIGNKSYFEVLQKCTHLLGLHFLAERNAYCRLDKRGDVEEVIRFIEVPAVGGQIGMTIVTFKRKLLEWYAALTDSVIVRAFDFTRLPKDFRGWSTGRESKVTDPELMYRFHVEADASYVRGVQILKPTIKKADAASYIFDGEPEEERFESFIAFDWRHKEVREISCAPDATANYFVKSNLPFEVSDRKSVV